MKTYRWNGEYWYHDKRNWLKRARQWLIWLGGWEKANGAGWRVFWSYKRKLKPPTPVSLFGHRITWYGWGGQIRLGRGWLVYARRPSAEGRRLYISKDGTPGGAFVWYIGVPADVVSDAETQRT